MTVGSFQAERRERRELVQKCITHPDVIADLLLDLLTRVERLEWMVSEDVTPVSEYEVTGTVTQKLNALLQNDPVTFTSRK